MLDWDFELVFYINKDNNIHYRMLHSNIDKLKKKIFNNLVKYNAESFIQDINLQGSGRSNFLSRSNLTNNINYYKEIDYEENSDQVDINQP